MVAPTPPAPSAPGGGRRVRVVRWAAAAALAAAALAGAGCGDADDAGDAAQPATDDSTFEGTSIGDLPRFPRSEPFGTETETEDIATQSFRARGTSPEQLIDWYDEALGEDWVQVEPVHREPGPGRADWVNGERRLELSAIDVDDRDGDAGSEAVIQYSLTLRPDEGGDE